MKQQDLASGFQKVDAAQVDVLADFLEKANNFPSVKETFDEQLKWMQLQAGDIVLDLGCGIGDRASEMAAKVGPSGRVNGIDLSESMVGIAKKRYGANGLPLHFEVADIVRLPFQDASFDRIRTERVLLYVQDLHTAFREVYRVLKPGGKFLAVDMDWDALTIRHPDNTLTRKIVHFISDSFPNSRIGAQLPRYFKDFGFSDIQVKSFGYFSYFQLTKVILEGILSTGVDKRIFTKPQITTWWKEFEQEDQNGNFFVCYHGFMVMGTKLG